MALYQGGERKTVEALSELSYCNPFAPERIALEREVLGDKFVWTDDAWHKRADMEGVPPNIDLTTEAAADLAEAIHTRLESRNTATENERNLYADVVLFLIYNRFQGTFHELILETETPRGAPRRRAPFYKHFVEEMDYFFGKAHPEFWGWRNPEHLFACFYQLRRAFHYIYDNIIGGSTTSARLRASVWESVFTHDMRRYRKTLYLRMGDLTTLITGPSGTGKELVAQAIGYSRYIPYSLSNGMFDEDFLDSFYPLNLSAFSPTLIESELFGHRKGAFTGALRDRRGWLEVCSPRGAVFLDEIGEIDYSIQVKLLRVLQTRQFQSIGDVETKLFEGKVIAATNRKLEEDIDAGRFREDLYYRLCSDMIVTPSLSEQIRESWDHLHNLILYIAKNITDGEDAERLAQEAETFILENLGTDYAWPGNVRELEQCIRNVLIRKSYQPAGSFGSKAGFRIAEEILETDLTAEDLLRHYVSLLYARTNNYQEIGRRLQLDGRTVKSKVDTELVRLYEEH